MRLPFRTIHIGQGVATAAIHKTVLVHAVGKHIGRGGFLESSGLQLIGIHKQGSLRPFRTMVKEKTAGKENGENATLYDILQVDTDATEAQIKKAFRVLALKLHPDKNPDKDAAEKFQQLQKVYEVLTDKERRRLYDETGIVPGDEDDNFIPTNPEDAYKYFRELYAKVTQEDIDNFEKKYRYSDEEKEDLMNFYGRFKGNVSQILAYIPYSEEIDVLRYLSFYDEQIQGSLLKSTKKYKKSSEELRAKYGGFTPRANETQKKNKIRKRSKPTGGSSDLALSILAKRDQREKDFDAFTDALAAKYGSKPQKKKKSAKR
ncbi:hypothetical protein NDN08_001110 [Rhodosorus marinus]|uniref:J domain-containing protein n=1 Tax=Rhodosorus marinus TaxID=101924 RepID=A0AAV8UTI2_9RHOD|nr:hypothetical protein NDN08_001110 [Rhodosorus marinus]